MFTRETNHQPMLIVNLPLNYVGIPVREAIFRIILGDTTEQETDDIVNATNTSLMGRRIWAV